MARKGQGKGRQKDFCHRMMAYSRNATRRGQGKGLQIAAVGADMYAWTEAGVGLTSLVRRGNMGGKKVNPPRVEY